MVFEGVETVPPRRSVRREPVIDLAQRVGPEPVQAALGVGPELDQAGLAEDPEMLGHRRLADPQLGYQRAHGAIAFAQEVEDPTPVGLRQHVEHRPNMHL